MKLSIAMQEAGAVILRENKEETGHPPVQQQQQQRPVDPQEALRHIQQQMMQHSL